MARITVEDCLTKETNRFGLVLLAAKRAKQILHGAKQVIEEERNNKAVVTALREIADGKVRFMNEAEMQEAEEKRLAERESSVVPDAAQLNNAAPLTNAAQLLAGDSSDDTEGEGQSRNGSSPAVV